jgi:hypothetical protein
VKLSRPLYLANIVEPNAVYFTGEPTADQLGVWVQKEYHGLVGVRTEENRHLFFDPLIVAYYNFDFDYKPFESTRWRDIMLPVARKFPNITFAVADIKEFQEGLMDEFNLYELPTVRPFVAGWYNDRTRFTMTEPLT